MDKFSFSVLKGIGKRPAVTIKELAAIYNRSVDYMEDPVLYLRRDSLCGEPVCLWLPERFKTPGTSTYVQGVEVESDYAGGIPEGFDIISLPASEYLVFQGEPFREEDYSQAILSVQYSMNQYDPAVIGYEWDDDSPRIQLEPRGERGYIELRAIKALNVHCQSDRIK